MVAVIERPVSRWQLLRRRAKRLGLIPVIGQFLFVALCVPVMSRRGTRRIAEIARRHGMDLSPIEGRVVEVPSVNSGEARAALRRLRPRVVVVNGTRIIGEETLSAVGAPFVNTHAGITPLYRGVHGGYWALAEGRPDLVGTTVHLLDRGVDTGDPLAQVTFAVTNADSFATYPYLHTAHGIPALLGVVRRALNGNLEPEPNHSELPSKLRYHPTLWGYLATRIAKGVR